VVVLTFADTSVALREGNRKHTYVGIFSCGLTSLTKLIVVIENKK
jgi:hypothetical protein